MRYKVTKGKALPIQEINLLGSIFLEVCKRFNEIEEQEKQEQTTRPKQA
jgi:hypothetical protein